MIRNVVHSVQLNTLSQLHSCWLLSWYLFFALGSVLLTVLYRVAQNKIPHQRICNISATNGLILKILEAA